MNFFLDHDVPIEVAHLLRREGFEARRLSEVMPVDTEDPAVFQYAQAQKLIVITCNRDHFLKLASQQPANAGVIISIRRRTRHAECAHLLALLRKAGETGIRGNINLA